MRVGFGEAALANMSKGKAYLTFLWEYRNVASWDDMFAIFLQEVVAKVAHLTVEAFVLSGSHALRLMLHNFPWGLASGRRRWPVYTRAMRIFSFYKNFARLPRKTKCSHSCCQKS